MIPLLIITQRQINRLETARITLERSILSILPF